MTLSSPVGTYDDAACIETDPSVFEDRDREAIALGYCRRCPLTETCLQDALATRDVDTVRGGTTGDQRYEMIHGAPPRKSNRKRPKPPTAVECGTERGYRKHSRKSEAPCDDCRSAHEQHLADRRRETFDEIAVQRAIKGDAPRSLTHAEKTAAVRTLTAEGLSDRAIAERIGVVAWTVMRIRHKYGIESGFVPAARWKTA